MSGIDFTIDGHVALVTLNRGENRFNPEFIDTWIEVLDEIENSSDALTLVVTSGHEKIFSNGIDLDWLMSVLQNGDTAESKRFFYRLNTLFKRTLISPLLTVAAINGHAFAGGAIWACAFDFRFMRSDRGYFCFPEADLKIPFLPGMVGLLEKAVHPQIIGEMVFTGIRLTAEQCREYKMVKEACVGEQLLGKTLAYAETLAFSRSYVKEMKYRMYKDIIHSFEVEDVGYIEAEKLIYE